MFPQIEKKYLAADHKYFQGNGFRRPVVYGAGIVLILCLLFSGTTVNSTIWGVLAIALGMWVLNGHYRESNFCKHLLVVWGAQGMECYQISAKQIDKLWDFLNETNDHSLYVFVVNMGWGTIVQPHRAQPWTAVGRTPLVSKYTRMSVWLHPDGGYYLRIKDRVNDNANRVSSATNFVRQLFVLGEWYMESHGQLIGSRFMAKMVRDPNALIVDNLISRQQNLLLVLDDQKRDAFTAMWSCVESCNILVKRLEAMPMTADTPELAQLRCDAHETLLRTLSVAVLKLSKLDRESLFDEFLPRDAPTLDLLREKVVFLEGRAKSLKRAAGRHNQPRPPRHKR